MSSQEFQDRALEEAGVALLSGESFGTYGRGCVRMSYANSQENLKKAVERLRKLVARHAR
jgi:aspartate/methionine/tyrosine aminotransferase